MNKKTSIFIGGLVSTIISLLIYWMLLTLDNGNNMNTLYYVGIWILLPYIYITNIFEEIDNIAAIVINTFLLLTSWIFAIPIGMVIGYIVWKTTNRK